jgi:hypothetical protein
MPGFAASHSWSLPRSWPLAAGLCTLVTSESFQTAPPWSRVRTSGRHASNVIRMRPQREAALEGRTQKDAPPKAAPQVKGGPKDGPTELTPLQLLNECEAYLSHVEWAQQLAESYRTRATMNEWAIYLAGTIALGALSAVAGLGLAAAAGTTTIGLIGVSSGFASGFFGFMDNKTRAGFYTVAANAIGSALAEADKAAGNGNDYMRATAILTEKVSQAANTLETSRKDAAVAAADAAKRIEATAKLEEIAKLAQAAAVVSLVGVGDSRPPKAVLMKTTGVDLEKYKGELKVVIDGLPADWNVKSSNTIEATLPQEHGTKSRVVLMIGPLTVPGETIFTYGN